MIPQNDPAFNLGPKTYRLAAFAVISAVSLFTLIYLGDLNVAHKPGLINEFLNYVAFACAFITVIFGFSVIVGAIVKLLRGNLLLFDDHVTWAKTGNRTNLGYEELEDAYIGEIATQATYSQINAPTYNFRRIVSFYIGNKRYNFRDRTGQDGTTLSAFLEKRIPKKNIDVDDDDPSPDKQTA